MKGQIEKVKHLKAVYLEYTDGSVIAVPENKALEVGTIFMKAVGKQELEWSVVRDGQPTLKEKIERWFKI